MKPMSTPSHQQRVFLINTRNHDHPFAIDPIQPPTAFDEQLEKTQEASDAATLATDRSDDERGWNRLMTSFDVGYDFGAQPDVQQFIDAYHANMNRLKSLTWLPDFSWLEARRYERLRAIAFSEQLGRPY